MSKWIYPSSPKYYMGRLATLEQIIRSMMANEDDVIIMSNRDPANSFGKMKSQEVITYFSDRLEYRQVAMRESYFNDIVEIVEAIIERN